MKTFGFAQGHRGKVAIMRISPLVLLLLFAMVGCDPETEPAKTPPEQPVKPDAASGGNQTQPQKVATTDKPVVAPAAKTPDAATVKEHMAAAQLTLGDPVVNSIGMRFVPIPAGTFTMGEGEEAHLEAHQVTLAQAFHLGVYEVTQAQYERVMGTNPSDFKGGQNPVEMVSWDDAVEFCRKLSELPEEKAAGYIYRLPTEAEWEYACRAGTTTKYSFGNSDGQLGGYAWFGNNSGDKQIDVLKSWETDKDNYFERILGNNCRSHPVGGKKPNGWGLYDMHGNVYEWCQDWYGDYPSGSVTDPTGAASGSVRVFRGGSWFIYSDFCRSAYRDWYTPGLRYFDLGFRVLRSSIK
jgi:formylglycine-generating enzyme required for sulfatase activity